MQRIEELVGRLTGEELDVGGGKADPLVGIPEQLRAGTDGLGEPLSERSWSAPAGQPMAMEQAHHVRIGVKLAQDLKAPPRPGLR